MLAKPASDAGAATEAKRQKFRYRQLVDSTTPSSKIKADDVPLMEGMKVVRKDIPSFSTLDPILQSIILERMGEYLTIASSYHFKRGAHQKMTSDPNFIPHSVQFKASLSALPTVRSSQGFKAASVKMDEIMKEYGLKLKEVFIDVSKLVVLELREQLLKSIVGGLPELGNGLLIVRGSESYSRHRIFVDLMEIYGDDIVKRIAPGIYTKNALVNAYKAKHNLQDLPLKSELPHPTINPYQAADTRLSGTCRNFAQVETNADPPGNGESKAMDTNADNVVDHPTVNATIPTAIGSDAGIFTPHRIQLIKDLADWMSIIYGNSWSAYSTEEEKILVRKNLRKLCDESSKSNLAEETNAILQRSDNLDRQSLDALVAKKCNEIIRASVKKTGEKALPKEQRSKNKGRGHVGAAGLKKSDKSNPPKKPSAGKKSRDAGVGGRGNASSNAAKGRGGGRSSSRSKVKGRGTSKGK
jgi:hypothetical protein